MCYGGGCQWFRGEGQGPVGTHSKKRVNASMGFAEFKVPTTSLEVHCNTTKVRIELMILNLRTGKFIQLK